MSRIISNAEIESRQIQNELDGKIIDAIAEVCKKYKHKVTYVEINTVLIGRVRSNLGYELKDIYKKNKTRM